MTHAADPSTQEVAHRHAHYPYLAGRTAVITGGSRGIGAATAAALAANGAAVAVVGRDKNALAAVTADITRAGGRAIWTAADCTKPDELQDMAASVTGQLGPIDILAAFAGGNGMPVPTDQETPDHWRQVIESDLNSTFYTAHAVLPGMIERHHGTIITMSSAAARQAARSAAAYAAAKAGVIAFTRHLADEMAPHRIRVNCLAPSTVENDRIRTWVPKEQLKALAASFPLRRIGQPDDIAAAALFLASDASSWITGTTLDIAGGKIMI
jgi:3-oxoacyl-[acyl-carrier protein] reductase